MKKQMQLIGLGFKKQYNFTGTIIQGATLKISEKLIKPNLNHQMDGFIHLRKDPI